MTEDEAKTKGCPLAWVNSSNQREYNIYSMGCFASACMMFRFFPDAKKTLKNGMIVFVDERDIDILEVGGWWWAGRYVKNENGYLHRVIVTKHHGEIPPGLVIDHRDRNPLNNRLGNLRICEQQQNLLNSKGRGGKSRFKGVFQNKGKWSAQISTAGIRECLGTFDTEEEAAKAYDDSAKKRKDEFSHLNFESPHHGGRQGYCGLAGRP